MSKRLTKALLRLCELEKKAQETDADFWKQEVDGVNEAFKEIEETNRQFREQAAKARFERDQAWVELKALAEENERLRKNTGWIHIRNFDRSGPVREVLGVGETGRVMIFRVEGRNQFSAACDFGKWEIATSPVWVMEIPPINYDEEPAVGDA